MSVNTVDQNLDVSRRKVLGIGFGFFSLATMVSLLYPAGRYLWPVSKVSESGKEVVKIPISELPLGSGKYIRFKGKPALVIFEASGNMAAISAVCTHLGCVVKWNPRSGHLECPCHGGTFDTSGNVISGPPPAPLPIYQATLTGDYVTVEEA